MGIVVKKTQNEKIHKNMNKMQCAGRTQRPTMDNIIIMSSITEKRRTERHTYFLQMQLNVLISYG